MQSQVALQEEVQELRAKVEQQGQRILELISHVEKKDLEIHHLTELNRLLKHARFGHSSEKTPPGQGRLFDEAEAVVEREKKTPRKPKAAPRNYEEHKKIDENLPRRNRVHDLPEDEKVCAEHGRAMVHIGEEVSEQLLYIPARLEVIRHKCLKYTCPECEGNVVTAKKPPQPIPGSIATPELLTHVAVSKHADGLPLYRQSGMLDRLGAHIDRTTMANWMIGCGRLLQSLRNLMDEVALKQPVLHMDETTVQVLKEKGRKPQTKSYMWVMVAGPPGESVVSFRYSPSRGSEVPMKLLGGYRGMLMVDGYEAYQAVCDENELDRGGCMAHARRKFVEAQLAQPKGKSGKADEAVAMFDKLSLIERPIKNADAQTRYQVRQSQSLPVIEELRQWLEKTLPETPPKTALGKALAYLHNQWPRLVRYLEDGRYPIDNNRAENAIRPFVVGRKNWLFSQSVRGAKASANLYSVIETAKANGVEPYAYLNHVLTELPKAETVEDIEALLPWKLKDAL